MIAVAFGKIRSWNILLSHRLNNRAMPLLFSTIFSTNRSINGLEYGGLSHTLTPPPRSFQPILIWSNMPFCSIPEAVCRGTWIQVKGSQSVYDLYWSVPFICCVGTTFKTGIHYLRLLPPRSSITLNDLKRSTKRPSKRFFSSPTLRLEVI